MEKRDDSTREEASTVEETFERTVSGLVEVGRLWAAHGLRVGVSALEASASTLRTTAGVLGEISDRFAADRDEAPGAG
jgi:hypothetical protein